MLGLPSDTLAWPRMAPLNGMPVEHRVCSVCLQGDNHLTHRGTHWRCTEGCNFDVCESCGTMEHVTIDNVANVAFSDTQHWLYKCFSKAPKIVDLFTCILSLTACFVVLPVKLLCCIESSVCHCLFGERLDHAKSEREKKEAEEKLAAQRGAAMDEQIAVTSPVMVNAPKPAMMFYAPPVPVIVQAILPQRYHNPYSGANQPFQPVLVQQPPQMFTVAQGPNAAAGR
jgi:hypothetical protein